MSTETLSARQERENQSLLYALETAVRAKHALWDALLQLAEIGYPGEEPPEQQDLDWALNQVASCSEPNDFKIEDVRQLLGAAKSRSEEPSHH